MRAANRTDDRHAAGEPASSINLVVAISAYKSDSDVIRLVTELYRGGYEFSSVVVVCSDGGDTLSASPELGEFDTCHVLPFASNLGSAGNLYQRFKAAAELGGDYMLALNHDARIDRCMFEALVAQAVNVRGRIGALYPLRFNPGRNQYDLTGVGGFPFRLRGSTQPTDVGLIDVTWSSSNGALYALAPYREGIAPDPRLWMGWEDYLYGLQLRQAGYRQCIVGNARAIDDYEYKTVAWFGRNITVSDKPVWYCYYGARNMALICLHRCANPRMLFHLLRWALAFPLQILLSRRGGERWDGLKYHAIGLMHGLFNRSGKWRLP